MRTVKMELLRPEEIVAERLRCPIVYLPIGPLEWHGPAMPLGTDPLLARAMAETAAQRLGGVVMPTLFFGTERERPARILAAKGFDNPEKLYILGMDVPKNSMKSFYAREELFALTVREHLRMLVQQGYRWIVLVNGHGAWGQLESLQRLAIEFSHETTSTVIYIFPDISTENDSLDFGHGTLAETSLMCYLQGENVDLNQLPARDIPLKYTDWGIADDSVFLGKRSPGDCVQFDPRDASAELGEKLFRTIMEHMCMEIQTVLQAEA